MKMRLSMTMAALLLCGRLLAQDTLVWSDEFDYEGTPDPAKWSFVEMAPGTVNNELQRYVTGDENCFVKDGMLHIRALKKGDEITSARITTRGKAEWLYGRFEARIKVPAGLGTWPAFWMMPARSTYGNWPRSGEIDIMEYVGYQPGTVHGTVHTMAYNHTIKTEKGTKTEVEGLEDDFHIFSCVWGPDKIEISVDGNKYFEFGNDGQGDTDTWPFDHPFQIILNVAIGGDWGGAMGVDPDLLPVEMLVDWVRVYQ